jgi:hypothetical protein
MEYLWPARRARNQQIATANSELSPSSGNIEITSPKAVSPSRSSWDSPRVSQGPRLDPNRLAPPLRKLGASRSFTDLRSAASESPHKPLFERMRSPDVRNPHSPAFSPGLPALGGTTDGGEISTPARRHGDAAEMKTRSSQKTFVLVRISRYEINHLIKNILGLILRFRLVFICC